MILSISNPKGGVGKTTIAINLAVSMLPHYKDLHLLDLDLQRSSSLWSGYRAQKSIKPDIPVLTVNNAREIPGVCGPYASDPGNLLIVDCGGLDSDHNREAMALSDFVIIPLKPSQVEVYSLKRAVSVIKALGKTGYILTAGAYPQSIGKLESLSEFVDSIDGLRQLKTVIRYRATYQDSYGQGRSVTEYDKNSPAAGEMEALRQELKALLKEAGKWARQAR